MRLRAARGAIRVPSDDDDALLGSTERLRSAFPAEAARRMGLGRVPLMCAQEIPVQGSMASVIRILLHFHSDRTLDEVVHVYLDGAESLRDDVR